MKKEWLVVSVLVLIGFLIRFFLLTFQTEIEVDGAYYADLAKKMVAGEAYFQFLWPPFYSFAIAMMSFIFNDFEFSGRFISLIMGTAFLPLIFFLGKKLFSPSVGWIALILAVFEPSLCFYSKAVLSESIYLLFFWLALIASGFLLKEKRLWWGFLCGIVWGIAYLTRQEGISYFFILILILFGMIFLKKIKLTKGIFLCLFLLIGFFLVSFPYLKYLKESTGNWTFTDKCVVNLCLGKESVGSNWLIRKEKALGRLTPDSKRVVLQYMAKDSELKKQYLPSLKEMLYTYMYNVFLFFEYSFHKVFPLVLIFFLGIGFFCALKFGQCKISLWWLMPLILPALTYPFFYFDIRYFFSLIPVGILFAALGLNQFLLVVPQKKVIQSGIIAIVILSVIPSIAFSALYQKRKGTLTREVGAWIQENCSYKTKLMDRYPQIAFYADAQLIFLPYAPLADILKYAKYHQAEVLVLRKSVIEKCRPWLLFLFEEPDAVPELKLIYRKQELNDEVLIFHF